MVQEVTATVETTTCLVVKLKCWIPAHQNLNSLRVCCHEEIKVQNYRDFY